MLEHWRLVWYSGWILYSWWWWYCLQLPLCRLDTRLHQSTSEIPMLEILDICWMDRPVVTFPIFTPLWLTETIINREIVSHTVLPAGFCKLKVRVLHHQCVIDLLQWQSLPRWLHDGSSYELNERSFRFPECFHLCFQLRIISGCWTEGLTAWRSFKVEVIIRAAWMRIPATIQSCSLSWWQHLPGQYSRVVIGWSCFNLFVFVCSV